MLWGITWAGNKVAVRKVDLQFHAQHSTADKSACYSIRSLPAEAIGCVARRSSPPMRALYLMARGFIRREESGKQRELKSQEPAPTMRTPECLRTGEILIVFVGAV